MSFVNFFSKKNKSKDLNSSYDSDSEKSDKNDKNNTR